MEGVFSRDGGGGGQEERVKLERERTIAPYIGYCCGSYINVDGDEPELRPENSGGLIALVVYTNKGMQSCSKMPPAVGGAHGVASMM